MANATIRIGDIGEAPVAGRAAIFCDLDGCLLSGSHVYPDVPGFVARNADRLWIISNNSSDTAERLSASLAQHGLAVPAERILLAGEQAVRRIAETRPGAAVSIYAEAAIRSLALSLGLRVAPGAPDLVLLARDRGFSLADLGRLIDEVHAGADLVVTNLDTVHPDAEGRPVPETGAIVSALRACDPAIRFTAIGKPAPDLLQLALRRSGAAPRDCIFIGDNADTDGVAAGVAGIPFAHLQRMTARGAPAGGALVMPRSAAAGGAI